MTGAQDGGLAGVSGLGEVERGEVITHLVFEGVELHLGARGHGEGDEYPGYGGVNAGLGEEVPNDEKSGVEEERVLYSQASADGQEDQYAQGDQQRGGGDVSAVEDGDDDDAADVVDHGQGGQEDA